MSASARSLAPAAVGADAAHLIAAYDHCWQIATSHYENFSLGSWLLPRTLRRHIAAIYAFARTADDFADVGSAPAAERLAKLRRWREALDECFRGQAEHPIFVALTHTIAEFDLPIVPFRSLLQAFEADVQFAPFETFDGLRGYCRCSADPVGHLILYLFGYRDAERQRLADAVCTGLQLANFWQDVAIDVQKSRVYVPLEDLRRFDCSTEELQRGTASANVRRLMQFEVERTRTLLTEGSQLAMWVDRRLAREVRLFAGGGLAILDAIGRQDFDVLHRRPTLSKWTKTNLLLRTFVMPHAGQSKRAPVMEHR